MSIGSDIRHELGEIDREAGSIGRILSPNVVPYVLSTLDALVILLSSITGGVGYHLLIGNPFPNVVPFCGVGLLASFIHILRMSGLGYYELPESAKPGLEMAEIVICWFTTGMLLAFFAFLLKIGGNYSRGAFFTFYFAAPMGLVGARKLTKLALISAVTHGGIIRRDIVIVGDRTELSLLQAPDRLALLGATSFQEFELSPRDPSDDRFVGDRAIVASIVAFVRRSNCSEIVLALPWSDAARIDFIREQIRSLPVSVRLLPDSRVRSLSNFASSARQRVLAIEVQRAPLSEAERLVKRAVDVIFGLTALVLLLPVFALAAIAIKLDSSGPVIFRQHRKGFNGKHFVMLKFRTMTVLEDGPSIVQARPDDPRVTSVGRFLRSSSIDELPQLINVIRGDMSLIGPRPHALAHDNYFEQILEDYAFRHHVKPGLTGWAQCNGLRGATPRLEDIAERVKLDLWYVNNWSIRLDLEILIRTVFEVLKKRNAY